MRQFEVAVGGAVNDGERAGRTMTQPRRVERAVGVASKILFRSSRNQSGYIASGRSDELGETIVVLKHTGVAEGGRRVCARIADCDRAGSAWDLCLASAERLVVDTEIYLMFHG